GWALATAVLLVAALSWWNSRLLPRHNRTETVISAGTNAGGAAKTAEVNVADNSADEPILMADSEAGDFTLLPGSLPQETEDAAPRPMLMLQGGPEEGPEGGFGERIELLGFEGVHPGKVVTGVPFSATATTERTQTLADGTVIRRTTSSALYRDSQGRSRRE